MNTRAYDDVVIGAGIIGLAHACHLARRGRRVLVVERHARAQGASVRNFGMLWPIGQPSGHLRSLALRSRTLWLDVLREAGIWHAAVGSMHVACANDEAQVLREFADMAARDGFECELLDPVAAIDRCHVIRPESLKLALWSPNEVCVDPRRTIAELRRWLEGTLNVRFEFDTQVTGCEPRTVVAGERRWEAERIWVCPGDELQTLFVSDLQQAGLVRCKLQMMRSEPITSRLGPMLAAGLTLRHYKSFMDCPTLPALTYRLEAEFPDYVRLGIHVLVAQNGAGELVLGDSHEYGDDIEPFDKAWIETLILNYLRRFINVQDLRLQSRWHGYYVRHPSKPYIVLHPQEGITIVTGLGGHGMTMSFGLAEAVVETEFGRDSALSLDSFELTKAKRTLIPNTPCC